MVRIMSSVIACCVLFLLAACSSGEDIASAEQELPRFRELMAAAEFSKIFEESSPELKQAISEQDFVKFLESVHRKLGTVRGSERSGWRVNVGTSGTFVSLGYKTGFEHGDGTEQFIFRVSDGKAALAGYRIDSMALVTN